MDYNNYDKVIEGDLKAILSTENGRRYLHYLIHFCGLYSTSMTGSSETFFREGMRSVGLKLLADITRLDPEGYFKMLNETKNIKQTIKVYNSRKDRLENE